MDKWKTDINRGMLLLSKHNPGAAIIYFTRALSLCPVSNSTELSRLLFYLGIALKRLGFSNSAIRSWIASQKLRKRKNIKKMLQWLSNQYGMAKQDTEEKDDWQAFYSIQVMRYLKAFNKRTPANQAERDMLKDIIHSQWEKLKDSGILEDKSAEKKSEIFKHIRIDFPLFFLKGVLQAKMN